MSERGFSVAEGGGLSPSLWPFRPSRVLVRLDASPFPSVPIWVVSDPRCTSPLSVCLWGFVCLPAPLLSPLMSLPLAASLPLHTPLGIGCLLPLGSHSFRLPGSFWGREDGVGDLPWLSVSFQGVS